MSPSEAARVLRQWFEKNPRGKLCSMLGMGILVPAIEDGESER